MQKSHRTAPFLGLTTLVALGLTAALSQPAAAQFTITANVTDPGNAPSAAANADVQNALNFLATDFQTNNTASFNLVANITWADQGFSRDNGYTLGSSSASAGFYQTVNNSLVINPLDRYVLGNNSTVDTSGNYQDFYITLNSNPNVPLDFTLGTPSNPDNYSLASIMYHEALHSMGFAAFNNADGSYSFDSNGGSGTPTPTLWDTLLYDGTTKQAFTADTQAQRKAVMVSGNREGDNGQLFFIGAQAEKANGGQPVAMYAPSGFLDGSSDGSHIANSVTGAGLLYPAMSSGNYLTPSPLELAMMQDIGWKTTNAPVPESSSFVSFGVLLALGLGGIVASRRRKAAGKAV